MDYFAYRDVFDAMYTQYYPHEHLDRPVISSNPDRVAYLKDNGTRSKYGEAQLSPDLYKYLRDDIEIVAGELARLDMQWASKVFIKGDGINENDKDWYLNLAKFGHALHAVEDFFAHSNYIELAAKVLGDDYLPRSYEKDHKEILNRRLMRLPNGRPINDEEYQELKLESEDFVVTGYFDFQDTIVSLCHIAEHVFEIGGEHGLGHHVREAEDLFKELIDDPELKRHELEGQLNEKLEEAQKIFKDTVELLNDPENVILNDKNVAVKNLQELAGKLTPRQTAVELCKRVPLLNKAPEEVQVSFINAIELWTRAKRIYGYGMTLYEFITGVKEFLEAPSMWLKGFLREIVGEWLANLAVYEIKQYIYQNFLNSMRIGCHSLIAKDHGTEFLYKEQKNCAIAVHWYITKSMLRRAFPEPIHVSRASLAASGSDKQKNVVNTNDWIDWVELLEYFLRNPAGEVTGQIDVPQTILHRISKGDTLANLADRYRATAIDPGSFTWEIIADYNFNTKGLPHQQRCRKINEELRDSGRGVKMGDHYAFKEGILVRTPHQRRSIPRPSPSDPQLSWYAPVMKDGWKVFSEGRIDRANKICDGPLRHHTYMYVSESEVRDLAMKGNEMRVSAEAAYVPAFVGQQPIGRIDIPEGNDYNRQVLSLAHNLSGLGFAADENGRWKGTGVPDEIIHNDHTILSKSTIGTYCCGYTFYVAFMVATREGLLADKSVDQIRQMQREWYGNMPLNSEGWEQQCAVALRNVGIGQVVSPAEAKSGDFVQFWRDKGGHSVIFLEWILDRGRRIGIRYRSSQGSTNGIGDRKEFFLGNGGFVNPNRIYVGRMMKHV